MRLLVSGFRFDLSWFLLTIGKLSDSLFEIFLLTIKMFSEHRLIKLSGNCLTVLWCINSCNINVHLTQVYKANGQLSDSLFACKISLVFLL